MFSLTKKGGNSLTGYWTYAQGFDALLDAVQFNSSYCKLLITKKIFL